MKFNYGSWELTHGVAAHYATQVVDVQAKDALTLLASTRPVEHRFQTLNYPTITVTLDSPLEGVIRVACTHFHGARSPSPGFDLQPGPPPDVHVEETREGVSLISGSLMARVVKGASWDMRFEADDRPLTRSAGQALAWMEVERRGGMMREKLSLAPGEHVYGLGERFTPFVRNGQSLDSWNRDGGAGSDHAYKCVPFYLSNRGYGVFVNHSAKVEFEIGTCDVSAVEFSVPGERLEYFFIYGPTPKEVLRRYTALTGRAPVPPAWSFGLWLTTSFVTDYDEGTVAGFLDGMEERKLPLHVFHFDCFWMREYRWCDFTWDSRCFPDPPAMLERIKQRGLKICVWINPYIAQHSPLFDEGVRDGFLLKRLDGSVWQTDQWQAGMGIVDFTHPGARQWYASKLRPLLAIGVDCFKTDFGERIPLDVAWHDGADPACMHNYYAKLYNQVVFDLLKEVRGESEAVVFARSATGGCQQYPVHWGGDCLASFEAMAANLRGGLSLGLCGFSFWSHDMGGFAGTANPAVYKRWLAFGMLSSHSRLHGCESYRVPWLFDDEAVDVLRHFTNLKCRLMPYLLGQAVESAAGGLPLMRAMMLEFPDNPACATLDRQYMLGGDILVAPVFSEDGIAEYFVPEGRWTHFMTGKVIEGGRWVRERHDMLSIPLLARPGSIIPVGANDQRPDYAYAQGVCLHVFETYDGGRCSLALPVNEAAKSVHVELVRLGNRIQITADASLETWSVLFRGVDSVVSATGARATSSSLGVVVHCDPASQAVDVVVRA